MGLLWFAASKTKIDLSKDTLFAVAPLAVVHTLGNLLTNVSLGMVAVSFTHTIKALEPMFSVVFSFLFLGESPNPLVLLTLIPIMGGVIGAAMSEANQKFSTTTPLQLTQSKKPETSSACIRG